MGGPGAAPGGRLRRSGSVDVATIDGRQARQDRRGADALGVGDPLGGHGPGVAVPVGLCQGGHMVLLYLMII